MLPLVVEDSELQLAPDVGGSIAAWRWRGHDLLRAGDPASGPLALGSFPLVPFSNRIAAGRFVAHGRPVTLAPNHHADGRAQTLHGFGWQAAWDVADCGPDQARLVLHHAAGAWPWAFTAQQHFALRPAGLALTLLLTNDADSAMPGGVGIHPYFPRAGAVLDMQVDGRWDSDDACLPTRWRPLASPPPWLNGEAMDHGFTGRRGPITIGWPTHRLVMTPSAALAHTIVYAPPNADYFCVEPVSHMTNAVNRPEPAQVTGLSWLAPGETMTARIDFALTAN